jgi:hypothetical protein
VRVDPKPILPVCLLATLLSCAGVDEGVLPDGGGDVATGGPDRPDSSALGCSITQTVELKAQPADVLLLLDRSGSMEMAFGSGTRYQAVSAALGEVVSAHAQHVRFGYQEFPSRQGCAGPSLLSCCVLPPTVGVGTDQIALVLAAIAGAGPPDGNSPTAAALRAARAYYEQHSDGIENRYVLLATDGAPDCTLDGTLSDGGVLPGGACADAVAEVVALVSAGVRVIVLGVGADSGVDPTGATDCLDALAHAGGAAVSPGSPGFYSATDVGELNVAVEQIFGGVARASCGLRFPTDLEDTSAVALYLDGQQIPRTSLNGWRLDVTQSPPVARVTGIYCDAIQTFQIDTIEVRFGCPPDLPVP